MLDIAVVYRELGLWNSDMQMGACCSHYYITPKWQTVHSFTFWGSILPCRRAFCGPFWALPVCWLCPQTPSHGAPAEYPGGKKTHDPFKTTRCRSKCQNFFTLLVNAHLISRPNDKDSAQDESFTSEVSPKAPAVGPPEAPPDTNTQEHGEKHPPLLRAVEISLWGLHE